ncbi:MAG: hypothetical protein ACRD9Y_09115 [Blastocatellia bacterium]
MRKRIFNLAVALSFAAALVATTAAYPFAFRIRAEIPFDFTVGNKRLPKGEYTIESLNEAGTVIIRSDKKGKALTFNIIRGKMTDKPKSKLVFHRYGDQYFLARIWDGSSDTVLKLDKSKAEKKAAKLAKKEENPDEVPVSDK